MAATPLDISTVSTLTITPGTPLAVGVVTAPAHHYFDDFNRADGVMGDWSSDGDVTVYSNAMRNSQTYPNAAALDDLITIDDISVTLLLVGTLDDGTPQLYLRSDDTFSEWYRVTWSASELFVEDDLGDLFAYAGGSFGSATEVGVIVVGGDFELYLDGSLASSGSSATYAGGAGHRRMQLRLSNPVSYGAGVDEFTVDAP